MVIAVAGHEMPLGAKVVVHPNDTEVIVLRQLQSGQVSLRVDAIARRGREIIRQRHVCIPELTDERIDTNTARIAQLAWVGRSWAHGWLNCPSGYRINDRNRVDVVNPFGAARIGDQTQTEPSRGHALIDLGVLWITASLVIGKDISLAAPERRPDWSACGSAEAIIMIRDQRCALANNVAVAIFDRGMAVEPRVRAEIASQIVLVCGAVPSIAAAAGRQHHLRAG